MKLIEAKNSPRDRRKIIPVNRLCAPLVRLNTRVNAAVYINYPVKRSYNTTTEKF